MGSDMGHIYIYMLSVYILTYAQPSPPLLTLGARHSHGCGRLYACSPPGDTVSTIYILFTYVINTVTTTTTTCVSSRDVLFFVVFSVSFRYLFLLVFFHISWLDQFIRGGVIQIYRISRSIYSGFLKIW
jgi:hypothetical protein